MKSVYFWAVSWASPLWTELSLVSRALCGSTYLLSFKFGRIAGVFPGTGEAGEVARETSPERMGGDRTVLGYMQCHVPGWGGERERPPGGTDPEAPSARLCAGCALQVQGLAPQSLLGLMTETAPEPGVGTNSPATVATLEPAWR